ncbi:MAG: hypothetical protein M1821_006866 [Bathelium mastoideum]|nr:MAG: hypothetical protein M1821_006866 [Bathelium mastoideum]
MAHYFSIKYLCDHQYNFAIPRFRGEEKFQEVAANDRAVMVEHHCPHCQQHNHAELSQRLTYLRRITNPCSGTDFHQLDCGHYVRCSDLLNCAGDCDYRSLWIPQRGGCLGCRQCVVTYFQARVKAEYDDLTAGIADNPDFVSLRRFSQNEHFLATPEGLVPIHLTALEATLDQYYTELVESLFFCEPVDADLHHNAIEMDTLMGQIDIAALDLSDQERLGHQIAMVIGSSSELVNEEDDEDDFDPIEAFWHRDGQQYEYFGTQAVNSQEARERERAAREETPLLQRM